MPAPIVHIIELASIVASASTAGWWRVIRRRAERHRARRELAKPPVLGATTPEGTVVKVTGAVRAVEELFAPLSGQPCVLYRSYSSIRWSLPTETGDTRFVVETIGGPVLVDSEHAVLDVEPLRQLKVTKQRREQFRLRMGLTASRFPGVVWLRFEEYLVAPGDVVSVVGLMMLDTASEPPRAESGFREDPPPQRRLTGNAEHPIVVSKVG